MKKLHILLFALLALGASCKSQEEAAAPVPPKPVDNYAEEKYTGELFFKMERSACYGRCPVYEVTITPSGEVTYLGKHFVELEGLYKAQVSEAFLAEIAAYAKRINYFELEESYDSPITDIPSTKTEIWMQDQHHAVYNRYDAPKGLNDFQDFVEEKVNSIEGWERVTTDQE